MANAQLIVSQPGRRMRRVEVYAGLVSIGRRADNTLSLEGDTNVSKYHAVIEERGGGGFWVTDLGSSNGTYVNGEPLRGERKLSDGDLISVGGTSTIEFRLARAVGDGAGGPEAGVAGAAAAGAANSGLAAAQGAGASANAALSSASSNLSSASSAASSLGSLSPAPAASSHISSALAPANAAASSASSAMSTATSTASAATAAAAAPASSASSMLAPGLIVGGVAGVTLIGVVLAILFGTGSMGGARKAAPKDEPASIDELLAQPDAAAPSADAAKKDDAAAASASSATAAPAGAPAAIADAPLAPAPVSGDVSPQEIAVMSSMLASQLTQRSGSSYSFDENFVARIKQHINEYRTAAGYYERAHKYQGAVEREFANNKGVAPLLAYLLAMSRTRFVEREGGVWQLPAPIARYYAPDMTMADLNDPDKSARVAATYTKQLLDTFQGKDNFMYAVACYGMPINEAAGTVLAALQAKDPGGDGRFDFWKMKNAGVVGGDQVEAVARFFAAGIVCENPQRFGLRQDKALSSIQ